MYQGVGVCVCVSELESYMHVYTRKNRFSFGSGVCEIGFGKKSSKVGLGMYMSGMEYYQIQIYSKKRNNIFVSSKLKRLKKIPNKANVDMYEFCIIPSIYEL